MPGIQRITSPEQLNDYIHVTNTGIWIILASILVFLLGFVCWIFAGTLEVSFASYLCNDGATSLAFITPDNASKLKQGMTVRIPDTRINGTVAKVDTSATPYSEIINLVGETNADLMGIHQGDKLMKVNVNILDAPEKVSRAVYVVDTVRPLSFLLK